MSQPVFSQQIFIQEMEKVIPEWNIELFPHNIVESPEKYTDVQITSTLTNRETSEIHTNSVGLKGIRKNPWQFGPIFTAISNTLYPGEFDERNEELRSKLSEHFSNFLEKNFGPCCYAELKC